MNPRGKHSIHRPLTSVAVYALALMILTTTTELSVAEEREAELSEAPEVEIPVRDRSLLYARYGAPGAVRIERRNGVSDSLWSLFADEQNISGAAADSSLLARLREILREEFAVRPVVYPNVTAGPGTASVGSRIAAGGASGTGIAAASRAGTAEASGVAAERGPSTTANETTTPSPDSSPPSGLVAGAAVGAGAVALASDPSTVPVPIPLPVDRSSLRRQFVGEGLIQTNLILFETGRHEILPYSSRVLDMIGSILQEFPLARVTIEGHTDSIGTESYNLGLSDRRASAVLYYLRDHGISEDRMSSNGFGETVPLMPNSSETTRALNRRVVLRVDNPEALERDTHDDD